MLQGETRLESTGAVGHPVARGRVMNVSEIRDRETLIDGRLDEADGVPDWVVNGSDTDNLTTDADHRIGPSSLEFDKVDGAANTVYAGVKRLSPDSTLYDVSRLLGEAAVLLGIKMSSLADVAQVELRLGADESNYQLWAWADGDLVANAWNDLSARLDDGAVVGNGWDPADVRYAAVLVKFDAESDALADILVDYAALTAEMPGGLGQLRTTNLAGVTSATDGAAVDTRRLDRVTVFVKVTGNTGAVTVSIEASPNGTDWYLLDSKTYTATNANDSWGYMSHFPMMRTTTTAHATATVSTVITGK